MTAKVGKVVLANGVKLCPLCSKAWIESIKTIQPMIRTVKDAKGKQNKDIGEVY